MSENLELNRAVSKTAAFTPHRSSSLPQQDTLAEEKIHVISSPSPLQQIHTISIEEDRETPIPSQNRLATLIFWNPLANLTNSFFSGGKSKTNRSSSIPGNESTTILPQAENLIRRQRKGLLLSKEEKNKSSLLPHKSRSNSRVNAEQTGDSTVGYNALPSHPNGWVNFLNNTRTTFFISTAVLHSNMGKIHDLKSKMGAKEEFMKMPTKSVWRSLVAEFLGSLLLISIGCGVNIYVVEPKPLNPTGVSLCWGFVVATLAQVRKIFKSIIPF